MDTFRTHMRVNLCRLTTIVPQQLLYVPQIRAVLQQMRRITVPQPMQRYRFLYACLRQRLLQNTL